MKSEMTHQEVITLKNQQISSLFQENQTLRERLQHCVSIRDRNVELVIENERMRKALKDAALRFDLISVGNKSVNPITGAKECIHALLPE